MRNQSRTAATMICLAVLVLALSSAAQAASPYFSLSSDKTYSPGEKIKVHLYTRDVQALEFRLYRVNNPVLFFEKLRDIHGFGTGRGYTPREQIEEKTWIEEFHDWKRHLWREIRDFFREQFSDRSRAEIREHQGKANKRAVGQASPATVFAQVPLLNSSQLVARWRQEVPRQYLSTRQDV
ncbi:MAG TPA: hypothetical protein VF532_20120, partial [Candidatus Angelobacter sp.]